MEFFDVINDGCDACSGGPWLPSRCGWVWLECCITIRVQPEVLRDCCPPVAKGRMTVSADLSDSTVLHMWKLSDSLAKLAGVVSGTQLDTRLHAVLHLLAAVLHPMWSLHAPP